MPRSESLQNYRKGAVLEDVTSRHKLTKTILPIVILSVMDVGVRRALDVEGTSGHLRHLPLGLVIVITSAILFECTASAHP